MFDQAHLKNLLEPIFAQHQIIKSRITICKENPLRIEICLENQDHSMDLNLCETLSKPIADAIDAAYPKEENYLIDVCSFGLEEPLESDEEIQSSIGQYIHVDLHQAINGLDSLDATLLDYANHQLTLEYFVKGIRKKSVIEQSAIRFIRRAVKF